MNIPKKHHYIPQSILNRFCDKDGKLFTFNKKMGKLGKKRYPTAVCYEENLHTLVHDGEKYIEIEKFYSTIESQFLELFRKIDEFFENPIDTNELKNDDNIFKIISLFLSLSFWRILKRNTITVKNRSNLRRIFDRAPVESKELLGFDRKLVRDIEKKNASASLKIAQFVLLPVLLSDSNNSSIRNCWFYQTNFDQAISDDPLVCDIDEKLMLSGEIYAPISSRICITNSSEKIAQLHEKMLSNATKMVMANSEKCFLTLHTKS